MEQDRIVAIAEKIVQSLRDDYPGLGTLGWMWTQHDLDNADELYFEQEGSIRHLVPTGGLNASEEKLLFEELQRLVKVELEQQEDSLEDGALLWVEWIKNGDVYPADDGHPLTKKLLARIRTKMADEQLGAGDDLDILAS